MARHNDLGRLGEQEACYRLSEEGYSILARNWTCGHLEIDIVAEYYGEIVFVEVKTRSREDRATALEAVDEEKRRNVMSAARAYLAAYDLDTPVRFDVITVVGAAPPFEVAHYRDAYAE